MPVARNHLDAVTLGDFIYVLGGRPPVTTVNELTAGGGQGWELVFNGLSADAASRLGARAKRVTRIAEGRYTVELGSSSRPEPLIAELAAAGASLVSVSPLRTTLEDVFVSAIGTGAA